LPLAAPVGAELDRPRLGRPGRPVLMQTAPLANLITRPAGPDGAVGDGPGRRMRPGSVAAESLAQHRPAVELAATPSQAWLAVAAGRKGGLPEAARHVLTAVDQVRFAHGYADGTLVAIGRGTVTGQGRWLGLSLIEVLPEARRQGLAGRVVRALADWAAEEGAGDAFLQVEQRNTPAVALYRALAFTTHHTYLTRVAPTT
ncbi:GNAT family N-acetyltransferase, partial [Micromonospora sp. ATA32]|nr:GNAT family N-acetyltransferase [Micromonospora sp. ATA32]